MSMHKILLTKLELTGLIAHGLEVNKPSQLSDVFRQGVAWAIAENNTELNKLNHKNHVPQNRIDELKKALDKLIDRTAKCDSGEYFPESWIDEAYEALKEQ
jgi:hypothetical protein